MPDLTISRPHVFTCEHETPISRECPACSIAYHEQGARDAQAAMAGHQAALDRLAADGGVG